MRAEQQNKFTILCDTVSLIISSYHEQPYIPRWLFKLLHPRGQQVSYFLKTIAALKASATISSSASFNSLQNNLILLLDNHRYYLSVHSVSSRLRALVQDAILVVLNFQSDDIKLYQRLVIEQKEVDEYISYFQNHRELQAYKDYFAKRHAAYGVPVEYIKPKDLMLYAKASLINGKIVKRFGIRNTLKRNVKRIKQELRNLVTNKVEAGFLTLPSAEGYIEKINLLVNACDHIDPELSNAQLIQNARYVIEAITNSAGVLPLGPAKHPQHAVLITSCYWVDEVLQQARGIEEIA